MKKALFGSQQRPLKIEQWILYCYILDDYSAVMTRKSISRIFGYGSKADWLIEFLDAFKRYDIISGDLLESVRNPIIYQVEKFGGGSILEEGYDLQILFDVCDFILAAKNGGFLSVLELKIAKTAEKILHSFDYTMLRNKVAENSGFEFFKEKARQNLLQYFQIHEANTVSNWIVAFPDKLWETIFKLVNLNWPDFHNSPRLLAHFVHDNIFMRLSHPLYQQLINTSPKRSYRRKNGQPQLLIPTDLSEYFSFLEIIAKASSYNIVIFEQLLERSFPKNVQRPGIVFHDIQSSKIALSDFDKQLQKGLMAK
jgi:hypothetical protein